MLGATPFRQFDISSNNKREKDELYYNFPAIISIPVPGIITGMEPLTLRRWAECSTTELQLLASGLYYKHITIVNDAVLWTCHKLNFTNRALALATVVN